MSHADNKSSVKLFKCSDAMKGQSDVEWKSVVLQNNLPFLHQTDQETTSNS